MYRPSDVLQQASDVIDVADWSRVSEHEGGARDKQTLNSPADSNFKFLMPQHRYLLKFPNKRAPEQFWNEILAYRLAGHMGISVPPTHLAVNSVTRQVGALSEYFRGYSNSDQEQYRSGGEILGGELKHYDRRRDRRHSFSAIASWCHFLERNRFMVDDWREYWAKAFLLDSLMGNTDRHHDNWGTVWTRDLNGREKVSLTPLFDNGTSLAYEMPHCTLDKLLEKGHRARYVNRGSHQMRWRPEDSSKLSHPAFLKRFYNEFPQQRNGILSRLNLSNRTIIRTVEELKSFNVAIPLTDRRAKVMVELLIYRRDNLRHILAQEGGTVLLAA